MRLRSRTLKTKEQWLVDELPKWSSQVETQLQQTWIEKHCGALAKGTRWKIADHVFECFRSPLAVHELLIRNWFLSETGLTTEQTLELTGPLSYL